MTWLDTLLGPSQHREELDSTNDNQDPEIIKDPSTQGSGSTLRPYRRTTKIVRSATKIASRLDAFRRVLGSLLYLSQLDTALDSQE